MKQKIFTLLFPAVLFSLALSGCGGRSSAPRETPKATPAPAPEATKNIAEETPLPEAAAPEETAAEALPPEEEPAPAAQGTEEETVEETEAASPDGAMAYRPLLDEIYNGILYQELDWDTVPEGLTGVMEVITYQSPDEALRVLGYTVRDVSGDGVPELLIGQVGSEEAEEYGAELVFAVFTLRDEAPVLSFEGWYRNRYSWIGDGRFYNLGSGGAAYTILGEYRIKEDGSALECIDYYYTFPKDEESWEIGYYHNTAGESDLASSEELPGGEEEFHARFEDLEAQIQTLGLTPFSEYPMEFLPLTARQSQESVDFVAVDDDYAGNYTFTAKEQLQDMRFLSLALTETEDGGIGFAEQELYSAGTLRAGESMTVRLSFPGDLPCWGIAFTDASGIARHYSLNLSGLDGSLCLAEY